MNNSLQEKLNLLPPKPGVYQYFNAEGKLLYVGKAKNIERRVKSYFARPSVSSWTNLMVVEIADIKTIEVATETEALMLENSLIKSLRPKYNIMLRDDKTFPFVRVSHEDFPMFTVVRKVKSDKAKYYGPFLTATYLRGLLQLTQNLYGIRLHAEKSYESRSSLPNEIGLGTRHLDNKVEYVKMVDEATRFIASPQPQMERTLKAAMEEASRSHHYEKAAIIHGRLNSLIELRNNQSMFSPSFRKLDYVGIATAGEVVSVFILCEREGKIVNQDNYMFQTPVTDMAQITEWVIRFLYINALPVPNELVISSTTLKTDRALCADIFKTSGLQVKFVTPQRGELKARLERAEGNAAYQLKLESVKKTRRESALASLTKLLDLKKIPKRIEAFDISNLGASNIVGATIVFIDGHPTKKEYRRYIVNNADGPDDFAAMRELVYRRLTNKDRPVPDLLLVDGGKGQLSAAKEAMQRAKISANIIALAKKEELIYQPDISQPIVIDHSDPVLLLLTAIRDEVHRFVINFHRHCRSKTLLK